MKSYSQTAAFCLPMLAATMVLTALPATAATQTLPSGAVFWTGDGSYLSQANIPAGFYASGSPGFLDTLEDGTLDGSLSTSGGTVVLAAGQFNDIRDSVDADDGVINGTCGPQSTTACGSLFGPGSITLTFNGSSLPTAFGVAWTDGGFNISVTFSAIAANGSNLGSVTVDNMGDTNNNGGTAEDRFFGVQFAGGLRSITITNSAGGTELDHIQYGEMGLVPEPGSWALMAAGLAGLAGLASRARRRADA